jgi:hypothetical protein
MRCLLRTCPPALPFLSSIVLAAFGTYRFGKNVIQHFVLGYYQMSLLGESLRIPLSLMWTRPRTKGQIAINAGRYAFCKRVCHG